MQKKGEKIVKLINSHPWFLIKNHLLIHIIHYQFKKYIKDKGNKRNYNLSLEFL